MNYCDDHKDMVNVWHRIDKTVTELNVRVNGSIKDIEHHIGAGGAWRIAILGVGLGLIIQIVAIAYMYGQLTEKVFKLERIAYAQNINDSRK